MKKTKQEKIEEKKRVFDYMHTVADLNVQNTKIVWKTGIYIAALFVALFIASYFVSDHLIGWLTFLMPAGAALIAKNNKVRKTPSDIQFYLGWQNMWGMAAALAFIVCADKDIPVYVMFAVYYVSLVTALAMLFESMRVRYASVVFCAAACGVVLTGIQIALEVETTMQWCLGIFFFFDLAALLIGGFVMQWQVKKNIKNPINFPRPKD